MTEFKETSFEVTRFATLLTHKRTGEKIHFCAEIWKEENQSTVSVRYSHSIIPREGSGIYPAGTDATMADTFEDALVSIQKWVKRVEESYAVELS